MSIAQLELKTNDVNSFTSNLHYTSYKLDVSTAWLSIYYAVFCPTDAASCVQTCFTIQSGEQPLHNTDTCKSRSTFGFMV